MRTIDEIKAEIFRSDMKDVPIGLVMEYRAAELMEACICHHLDCQNCRNCKVDNDCHHSYLYCDKGCYAIDKDTSVATNCKSYQRR